MTTVTDFTSPLRAEQGSKLLRFGAVSAFNVIVGQLVLYGAQVALAW